MGVLRVIKGKDLIKQIEKELNSREEYTDYPPNFEVRYTALVKSLWYKEVIIKE